MKVGGLIKEDRLVGFGSDLAWVQAAEWIAAIGRQLVIAARPAVFTDLWITVV